MTATDTEQDEFAKTSDNNLHFYSGQRLRIAGRLVYSMAASLMVFIPVLLLCLLSSSQARLSVTAVFITTFAFALASWTRAGRHEIFLATAT